jgi:hypothetical protein
MSYLDLVDSAKTVAKEELHQISKRAGSGHLLESLHTGHIFQGLRSDQTRAKGLLPGHGDRGRIAGCRLVQRA